MTASGEFTLRFRGSLHAIITHQRAPATASFVRRNMSTAPMPRTGDDLLLAIETSCDETAAAVVDRQLVVRSNVVASQTDLHEQFGGVVPEIASRAHVRRILPVIDEALARANVEPIHRQCRMTPAAGRPDGNTGKRGEQPRPSEYPVGKLSAVAVVTEPGLVGSLLVGLTAAKTLSMVLNVPLVTVNHVEAHIFACRLSAGEDVYPCAGLVVSGGHTNLYDCRSAVDLELMGATIDDAAGEAFDKVAQILGLSYPGGPAIQRAAERGDRQAVAFPRPLLESGNLDFSFSGLKTAVLYEAHGTPGARRRGPKGRQRAADRGAPLTPQRIADLAASFQEAAVDVLTEKCRRALLSRNRSTLCVGGGVAANLRLRQRLQELCDDLGVRLVLSDMEYCTDNAAMAAVAWELLEQGRTASLDVDVVPGLQRSR